VPDVQRFLDSDVAPHGQLDRPLQLRHDEEGVVVFEVDGHGVEGERLDVAVRPVGDGGLGLRRRLQLGEAFDVAAGKGHLGSLGLDFVGRVAIVVAAVLDLFKQNVKCLVLLQKFHRNTLS